MPRTPLITRVVLATAGVTMVGLCTSSAYGDTVQLETVQLETVQLHAQPYGHSDEHARGHEDWHAPRCEEVDGDGALSFTTDAGKTITPTTGRPTPVSYTHVAALTTPNALVGTTKHLVELSTDAGCSWHPIAKVDDNLSQYDVTAGASGSAYVYGIHRQTVYVFDDGQVGEVNGPVEGDGVAGFAADGDVAGLVRAVDEDGQVYESNNGGATWTTIGHPPTAMRWWAYQAAIDPHNLDHIVLGAGDLSFVTFDGGQTWQVMRGLSEGKRTNVFSVAISPADSSVVWAEGYDLSQSHNGARHIWRSTDGGRTFTSILDGTDATLYNGTRMHPSPVDPNVVYFTYGTWFGGFGTNLYRLDISPDVSHKAALTYTHNGYDGISSIEFSPADPRVMYLGLEEER
ncbi:MAG: WD40/YVTN/BNR-like repeat-containing protein [Nocardioidaceae bacterium]